MQLMDIEVIKKLVGWEDIQRELGSLAGKTNDRPSFTMPEEWRKTYIGEWISEETALCLGFIGYTTGDLIPAYPGDGKFFKGFWDAEVNEPELGGSATSGVDGDYYVCIVGGDTNIDGNNDWKAGYIILNNKDSTGTWSQIKGGIFSSDFHKTLIKLSIVKRVGIRILGRAEYTRSRPGSPTYSREIERTTHVYEEYEEWLRIVKKGIGGDEPFPNVQVMMNKVMSDKLKTTVLNRPDTEVYN